MSEAPGPDQLQRPHGLDELMHDERQALTGRDTRYWLVTAPMAVYGRLSPIGDRLQAAYYFARHIDDVLDGDRIAPDDMSPLTYVEELEAAMSHEPDDEDPPVMGLFRYAFGESDEEHVDAMSNLIAAMKFDYQRAVSTREGFPVVMSEEELDDYFAATLEPPLAIGLGMGGSRLDATALTDIIQAMGHLYSLRDLEEDLEQGIINIPSEVIAKAGIEPRALTYAVALESEVIRDWMRSESAYFDSTLRSSLEAISRSKDRMARGMTTVLGLGLKRIPPKVLRSLT